MENITQDVIPLQQQSGEDKLELYISNKPTSNENTKASKLELVVTIHKIAQLAEKSQLCVSMIILTNKDAYERETVPNSPQQQQSKKSDLCTGCIGMKLPATIVAGMTLVKLPIIQAKI